MAPDRASDQPDAVTFATFTSLALLLSAWAREHALEAPQYRSPPRLLGVTRSLRRAPGCRPVVCIRLRGRGATEVVRDMVDGLLAVNPEPCPFAGNGDVPTEMSITDAAAQGLARLALRDSAIAHLHSDRVLAAEARSRSPLVLGRVAA